jgi:hypothetical protein
VDSTILDDAVATQDTVTQLIAAIRRVARSVPGAPEVIARHCRAHDYTRAGRPRIAWDDAAARAELVDALVGDAHRLLGHLPDDELDAAAAGAVALPALVAGQDVEPADDSGGTDGRWRIARTVAVDRVISTVDPDARHAHKTRSRRQDGYSAHLVVEPDTGIITDTALTPAAGPDNSDATVGVDLLLADTAPADTVPADTVPADTVPADTVPADTVPADTVPADTVPADTVPAAAQGWEVLGDSAYGTGDALAALRDAGHTSIIKPWPLRLAVGAAASAADLCHGRAAAREAQRPTG